MTKGTQGPSLIRPQPPTKRCQNKGKLASQPASQAGRAGVLDTGCLEVPWVLSGLRVQGESQVFCLHQWVNLVPKYDRVIEIRRKGKRGLVGGSRSLGECSGRVSLLSNPSLSLSSPPLAVMR